MRKGKSLLVLLTFSLLLLAVAGCAGSQNDVSEKAPQGETKEKQENAAPAKQPKEQVADKETAQPSEQTQTAFTRGEHDESPDTLAIPVLMYHSINENVKNNLIISPNEFEEQMKWLKDNGYHPLYLRELGDMLETGKNVPDKPVVITFDDGYQDNYTNAYPILKKYALPANIFVITSKIGADNHFDEQAMKEMSANGIEMESHTVNHPELNQLPYEAQLRELTDSKKRIEAITGQEVNSICYPVGRYNEDTEKAAQEAGYRMGFAIENSTANKNQGMYRLKRLRVSPGTKLETILPQ
ncbi:polysaccharide deacetylase family protein [Listeria costaricensis]|uniref:polysaccharide deacetylase family protein n=1 Tax=Listeria costaricensis TaxID=2026604 RepID=UPI0013C472FE|nr:polysaccharide deacetylase family protein [Listeria costaricensis]